MYRIKSAYFDEETLAIITIEHFRNPRGAVERFGFKCALFEKHTYGITVDFEIIFDTIREPQRL